MTARSTRRAVAVLILALGVAPAQQPSQLVSGQAGATSAVVDQQAMSTSGLLPVYGVELRLDKSWIDDQFPSQSPNFPNSGVSASFQQLWDTLKVGGFNLLRVGVDVSDLPGSANRAANLCNWGRSNNVKILMVLHGGQAGGQDYASGAAAFVKALAGKLAQQQYQPAYLQIAAYELEPDLNNPYYSRQVAANVSGQDLLLEASQSVRSAETAALQGSGLSATPLMVTASFDYELIKQKAIAGTPLDSSAYDKASSALTSWLKPLADSANIDILSVSWFPGSLSAGGVEKPPALLRSLAPIVASKQMLFITGFSTAFHTADDQKQYYTMTFANLADLRASSGADTPFVGVIYREALNGNAPTTHPALQQAMPQWNWQAKAGELVAMWNNSQKSDDMDWWVQTVGANMGLADVSRGNPSGKPALQGMSQIASAVSSASMTAAPATTPGQPAKPGMFSSTGQALEGKVQQSLSGLLDNVFQHLGTMAQSATNSIGTGSGFSGSAYSYPTNYPSSNPSAASPAPYGNPLSASSMPCPTASADTSTGPAAAAIPSTPCMPMQAGVPVSPSAATSAVAVPNTAITATSAAAVMPAQVRISLAKRDVSLQPASARVGQPVSIVARLQNSGSGDAVGVSVLASGPGNAVLAQTDSLRIPVNSAYPVTLQWVPKEAKPTQIVIRVSDGSGAEVASVTLDTLNVAAADAPGAASVTAQPKSANQAAPDGGISSNTADSSATAVVPLGFAKIGDIVLDRNFVAGQPGSVVVPVSNPLLVPMKNIRAMLMVDGKPVQSQSVALLIPQQTRSMMFSNVVIAQPGIHELKVGVQLQRGDAKPQMGVVSQSVIVNAPTTTLTARSAGSAAAVKTNAARKGTNAAAASQVRTLVPNKASLTTAAASPTVSASVTSSGAKVQPAAKIAQLTLTAQDLTYTPAAPGQTVEFRIVVRNAGDAPAPRAILNLKLIADGNLVAATEPPIQFSVAAKGSYQAHWRTIMPAGSQVELVAATQGGEAASPVQAAIVVRAAAVSPRPPSRHVENQSKKP